MRVNIIRASILLFTFLLFSCDAGKPSTKEMLEELEQYEPKQHTIEMEEGDFLFRLYTDHPIHYEGEIVLLKGELTYIGEEEEIQISFSDEPIYFNLQEKIRGYSLPIIRKEIGATTNLINGVPYSVNFNKSSIVSDRTMGKEEQEFIENFRKREDFPLGYYEVKASFDFFIIEPGVAKEDAHIQFDTSIDFKVIH